MVENQNLEQINKHLDSIILHKEAFINGSFVPNQSGARFISINPSTRSSVCQIFEYNSFDVDKAVVGARHAFEVGEWSKAAPEERKKTLLQLSNLIDTHAFELAILDTIEVGIPLQFSYNRNIKGVVSCLRWYAECIDKIYDEIAPAKYEDLTIITREPVGVVGAVVAWNLPLLVAATKIAPALAAGNSVILKPAEQSSLSALRLAELASEAGIPDGVLNVIPGRGEITGKALALHPNVDCITFTGSTDTGKQILQYAGQSNLKKVCLECGGKSPHIVFNDCYDLDKAAKAAASAMFFHQGQTCIASTRLFIQEKIVSDFMPLLIKYTNQFKPGNPLDPKCNFGPLVDEDQFNKVLSYITKGKNSGAKLLLGGNSLSADMIGYYVEPTIFTQVNNDMEIAQDEIFGPILSVLTFKDEANVVQLANQSKYGLGGSLWTCDLNRAHRVSKSLKVGMVRVNAEGTGGFIAPFGGFKQSGIGRDKGLHALHEYTELKSTIFSFV